MPNGKRNHGLIKIERRMSAKVPIKNKAGSIWTALRESGYNIFRVILDIPNTYTCLRNFLKSMRRSDVCSSDLTYAWRISPVLKLASLMRVLISMSSENISLKPPTLLYTSLEKPMLNVLGTNFSSCTAPPRMPPVVRKEVME